MAALKRETCPTVVQRDPRAGDVHPGEAEEVAGGLSEPETDALVGTIRSVHAAGVTIVWVEHIMRALTQVVQRAVCLADGRLLFDGTPEEMLRDPHVRRAYLGGTVA